jgi:peptidoglycan/xylan/chitin deacetylase (PgdA/CDA1 family)
MKVTPAGSARVPSRNPQTETQTLAASSPPAPVDSFDVEAQAARPSTLLGKAKAFVRERPWTAAGIALTGGAALIGAPVLGAVLGNRGSSGDRTLSGPVGDANVNGTSPSITTRLVSTPTVSISVPSSSTTLSSVLTPAPSPTPSASASIAGPGFPQALKAGERAQIDFSAQPPYLRNDTLVLTFDDGPDSVNTPKVLDVLARNGVKASFYINTENGLVNLPSDSKQAETVRRIVKDGHELANHAAHHLASDTLTREALAAELDGVQSVVSKIVPGAPKLTLFRAPFGQPFQTGFPADALEMVSSEVAKRAVHVGWNIDSNDWRCADVDAGAACVVDGFKQSLDAGGYGVVLAHSTQAVTAEALQEMIDLAKARGFKFALSEDVVEARYGKSSAELVAEMNRA